MTATWDKLPATRWQRFKAGWTPARLIGAVALLIGLAGTVQTDLSYLPAPLANFLANVSPELFGIGVTILVIDAANERRAAGERKQELALQMGSPDSGFAIEAVRILRHQNWLTDGTLRGVALTHASLAGADLYQADLQHAVLHFTSLTGANLRRANLAGAELIGTDLRHADLPEANLSHTLLKDARCQGTNLWKANLQGAAARQTDFSGATLENTNLKGAKLTAANLAGASLLYATFDEQTILPDGVAWQPDTDLRRFTDEKHPKFVRYGQADDTK